MEKPFKKTRVHYFIEKLNQVGLASGLRLSHLPWELRTVDIFWKILTWLRTDFLVIILHLGWLSLCSSLFLGMRDNGENFAILRPSETYRNFDN